MNPSDHRAALDAFAADYGLFITNIIGFSALIKNGHAPPEKHAEYATHIYRCGAKLMEIIQRLMDEIDPDPPMPTFPERPHLRLVHPEENT